MSDLHDLLLVLDLRADVPAEEIAELRWHLGLGPAPERLAIVTGFDEVVLDDNGEPARDATGTILVESAPYQLLAARGPARRVAGALAGTLEPRDDGGWALTVRQEVHPDEFEHLDQLLAWLATRLRHAGTHFVGYLRHLEDASAGEVLTVTDGELVRTR